MMMVAELDRLAYSIKKIRLEESGDIRLLCDLVGISILDVLSCNNFNEVDLWRKDQGQEDNAFEQISSAERGLLGSEDEFLAQVKSNSNDARQLVWLSAIARKREFTTISHYAASLALEPTIGESKRDDAGAIACLFRAVGAGEIELDEVSNFLKEKLELNGISVEDLYDFSLSSEKTSRS